jgi:hypothetical protein
MSCSEARRNLRIGGCITTQRDEKIRGARGFGGRTTPWNGRNPVLGGTSRDVSSLNAGYLLARKRVCVKASDVDTQRQQPAGVNYKIETKRFFVIAPIFLIQEQNYAR